MVLINPDEFHNDPNNAERSARLKLKTPKRVLHFSDGVLEEYSDDEEETSPSDQNALVDPANLTWLPWMWYKAWAAGASTLYVLDYIGESLAAFLGITTPKYYFELEEYKRNQQAMQDDNNQARGWSQPSELGAIPLRDMRSTNSQTIPV